MKKIKRGSVVKIVMPEVTFRGIVANVDSKMQRFYIICAGAAGYYPMYTVEFEFQIAGKHSNSEYVELSKSLVEFVK